MTDQIQRLRNRFGGSEIATNTHAEFVRQFTETDHERAAIYEHDASMTREAAERRVVRERGQG